jgi:hypothetical protein
MRRKGHRLSAGEYRTQVEDWRTKYTESAAALEDTKKVHTTELEKLKLDMGAKLTAAEKAAVDAKTTADERIKHTNLKVIAGQKGLLDLEFLKLLDSSKLKSDDEGNISNADAVFDAWKTEKPHLFGEGKKPGTETGTTSSTKKAPTPNPNGAKFDAMTATDAEWKAAVKALH